MKESGRESDPHPEQGGHFHEVIALHADKNLSWDELVKKIPLLPRGWFELSQLSSEDRIEFTRDFWLSKFPILSEEDARSHRRLEDFFATLEEVGIMATQVKEGHPFEVHMVYSLKDDVGFFQGGVPVSEEGIANLIKQFGQMLLPSDYLAFLRIHDGFSKYTDTGLIKSREMSRIYQRFQLMLADEILVNVEGEVINHAHLIPFYESFGLHCYQCFYADWYPETEMGNVYFSDYDRTISLWLDARHPEETLSFPTFLSWLVFYLEDIWHS